jgi:hypothetical protein
VTAESEGFEIEQGIFCSVPTRGSAVAPGTVAGRIELFETVPDFQWAGTRVPAVPGLSFGVKSRARDARLYLNVIMTLRHPRFERSGAETQSYITALGGEDASINAYTFDTAEELALGSWTFTARAEGKTLFEARFEVVPPEEEPVIAASCGLTPLS